MDMAEVMVAVMVDMEVDVDGDDDPSIIKRHIELVQLNYIYFIK